MKPKKQKKKSQESTEYGMVGMDKRYHNLRRWVVLSVAGVSLTPLLIMTAINYYQVKKAFYQEIQSPINRFTSNTKRSLEFFLEERLSALTMIIQDKSFTDLANDSKLAPVFRNLSQSFGGFVDLGLIDWQGTQRSYAGPYELKGKNYKEHDWFHEVRLRGVYISDVFMGYRGFPHFVIAVKHEDTLGNWYILRATIDSEMLNKRLLTEGLRPGSDAFLINQRGFLQSPSRLYGSILEKLPITVPAYSQNAEVIMIKDEKNQPLIMGYATIEKSPFIFLLLNRPMEALSNWHVLATELIVFVLVSTILILGVIWFGARFMINRIRDADNKRAAALHLMEYSNKLATVGRLAAGVAHEINNPLAIINEKAGLLKDLVSISPDFPKRQKIVDQADSILKSVGRCSAVTHRLLGFAKHMDVQTETIVLESLLKEVLDFLGKEASFRNVAVEFHVPEEFPSIESDRGQLQQVFLNIINNAFAAVDDGGKIDITIEKTDRNQVAISIKDNGSGIPAENLKHIFEPFFTTKKGYGTGLGLSITYGIVEKLGGTIQVRSDVGVGTCFTVRLPIKRS